MCSIVAVPYLYEFVPDLHNYVMQGDVQEKSSDTDSVLSQQNCSFSPVKVIFLFVRLLPSSFLWQWNVYLKFLQNDS